MDRSFVVFRLVDGKFGKFTLVGRIRVFTHVGFVAAVWVLVLVLVLFFVGW